MVPAALYLSASVTARDDAAAALSRGQEVFVSGFELPGAITVARGWGAAMRAALAATRAEVLAVQVPSDAMEALTDPIFQDHADVVTGHRVPPPVLERAANSLARLALHVEIADPLCAARAFRVEALRAEPVVASGDEAEAEALVKLGAQRYRFSDALVRFGGKRTASNLALLSRTFARYATVQNDADNLHEGYSTLAHLETGAPNYNRWLAGTFRKWAGARVLEIGAGIGTITAHLAPGRELVTALEVDPFYVRRLKNRFRGTPQVEPYQGDVALADWKALAERRFDTIVLSNVLEHIPDDAGAVQTFAKILPPGGALILFVPALPALFGSLDEAVGHHRRYTPASLREVLQRNGFDVEALQWMNLVGIPGWFVNGRVLKRRVLPPLQLRLYDRLAPTLASLEAQVKLPVGLSLLAVGRRRA
ncbi:MAG: class I SAM-dependent methyltransferase [Archangium sp.]|nr:class I SAM-dependent methyltransferase [Archangium sp.]